MPQFILLIREDLSRYPRPEEELKAIIKAHSDWARELAAKGIFKDGNGIGSDGRLIEMINGDLIVSSYLQFSCLFLLLYDPIY